MESFYRLAPWRSFHVRSIPSLQNIFTARAVAPLGSRHGTESKLFVGGRIRGGVRRRSHRYRPVVSARWAAKELSKLLRLFFRVRLRTERKLDRKIQGRERRQSEKL